MSHKKFGADRFSRFDVYWIQTNKQIDRLTDRQTDRQAKYIYCDYFRIQMGSNLGENQRNIPAIINSEKPCFLQISLLQVLRRRNIVMLWLFNRLIPSMSGL